MSLVTRCPRCRTLFRVTPNQLQVKSGRVRCGRCMNAFDAYDALAAETSNILPAPATAAEPVLKVDAISSAAVPGRGDEQKMDSRFRGNDGMPGAAETAAAEAPRAATIAAVAPTAPIAEPPTAPVVESTTVPRQPAPSRADAAEPAPEPAGSFAAVFTRPSGRQLWIAGAAALALILVVQLAVAYRSEIVARSPMLRSALTSICEHVGCRVSLPQRPELVRIEASDVHMVDASRPQLIQLTATLRSYAGYDLAYPALDLVLTNANEHALARRIFRPDEYLDATRDPEAGIPANAEITVALDLDTGDLNAAGFRLDLLAAPR